MHHRDRALRRDAAELTRLIEPKVAVRGGNDVLDLVTGREWKDRDRAVRCAAKDRGARVAHVLSAEPDRTVGAGAKHGGIPVSRNERPRERPSRRDAPEVSGLLREPQSTVGTDDDAVRRAVR